ncbi:hypothetical protein [Streptomyces sp. NPDC002853]
MAERRGGVDYDEAGEGGDTVARLRQVDQVLMRGSPVQKVAGLGHPGLRFTQIGPADFGAQGVLARIRADHVALASVQVAAQVCA